MSAIALPAFDGASRRLKAVGWAAIAWLALVLIVATIQSITYTGLIAWFSEWQFEHLGQAFPAMTFLLLVALFALPGLALLGLVTRRTRRGLSLDERALVIRRAGSAMRVFEVLSVLVALAALAAALLVTRLPRADGPVRPVSANNAQRGALPEGPVTLTGRYRYDRVATFAQNVLVARRDYRFVPVQGRTGSPVAIDLFAATSTSSPHGLARDQVHRGILRRDGLPPAVVRLYRDAGFSVSPHAYVLYASPAAMTWPYWAAAGQLAIVALVLAIAAVVTRRRMRRIDGYSPAAQALPLH